MNGLALSEAYFLAYGIPMIQEGFPELKGRIAAGLVGYGSDCFGFDDKISQDHDWGPGFCLWLEKTDYAVARYQLQAAYDALPDRYMGFERMESAWGQNRVGVLEIGEFYKTFIGMSDAPADAMKWLLIPEENLAACTNGKVFCDDCGTFSDIRKRLLNYYPEDVRLKRIAGRLMSAAQSGQYNFARCSKRKTAYPSRYALVRFCDDVLRLVFLLNRQFCPFYKWRDMAAHSLPILGVFVTQMIEQLLTSRNNQQIIQLIERICVMLIDELKAQRLSNSDSDFLLDHGPIVQAQIHSERIRKLTVWYAGA